MADTEYENTTAYENFNNVKATTLSSEQILTTVWIFVCMIPNALMIYIFVKNHLYSTNFYFILLNWCIANILSTSCLLYFAIVPEEYVVINVLDELYFIHIMLPTLTVILVTMFMFKKFIDSKKSCIYFICAFWCVFIQSIVANIVSSMMGYVFIVELLYMIGPIKLFSVVVLIIKMACHIIVPPAENDEDFLLRVIMAAVYILFDFAVWFLQFVIITEILLSNIFLYAVYASYADGYINLMLLVYCNTNIKYYFYELFRKEKEDEVSVHVVDLDDPSSKATA